ncbi:hypothetical protein NNX28_12845 [Arthrobacter sp. zg-Y859]|uniref:Uncharacterized protein n=1 Tax=Arthrobacter jinronghuae TaxID=2964609 RepID=A0ABT1NSV2_9MICC|nr:hypothetical protein [Arthrobacter jinronghuae]MCQ1950809.1 hypothetical protein [Arthrobacter jinronghuae]UWX79277.1 hypothetical protein N2K98_03435 [Arthrobacter jinronghuae]
MKFVCNIQDQGRRIDGYFSTIKQPVQVPAEKQTTVFMVLTHGAIAI